MENYVGKEEFNNLVKRVDKMETTMENSEKLLQEIERKIDVIYEKLNAKEEMNLLKMKPLEDRIAKLESGISWLWKLLATIIITGIVTAIINFN